MSWKVVVAEGDLLEAWREVHNRIIWTSPLTVEEVAERSTRNRLTLAYDNDELIGNATVRPPRDADATATVIVRVLPDQRHKGYGARYLQSELAHAEQLGATRIETVVLASNTDGLRFARAHGFVEHDRYLLDGDAIAFVDLHLPAVPSCRIDTDGRQGRMN